MRKAQHGGSGSKYNDGCRCDACKGAHRQRLRAAKLRRMAERIEVVGLDGRTYLLAAKANKHGSYCTYNNWGCRCPACRLDHARAMRQRKRGESKAVQPQ